jgi:hypothetical protein
MRCFPYQGLFTASLCLAVVACATPTKKADILDLYELPRTVHGQPIGGDNDSYYTQPMTYKGCAVINDAPSCGGG